MHGMNGLRSGVGFFLVAGEVLIILVMGME